MKREKHKALFGAPPTRPFVPRREFREGSFGWRLERAAVTFLNRTFGFTDPEGTFDRKGRFTPSPEEAADCCSYLKASSQARPNHLSLHCRTIEHVANRYRVRVKHLAHRASQLRREEAEEAIKSLL